MVHQRSSLYLGMSYARNVKGMLSILLNSCNLLALDSIVTLPC